MYNGVGLHTPRGSGTSGRVQASKFLAKPASSSAAGGGGGGTPGSGLEGTRKPNKDILEHDRKRQVELRLLVLRDALEEQGYTEAEIEERVEEARRAAEVETATAEDEEGGPLPQQGKGFIETQSHHAAARKEEQLETMKAALGLDTEDVKKGGVKADAELEEILHGKGSEGLDTDAQKDSKAPVDFGEHSKKSKEAADDARSGCESSRKTKHDCDSNIDHDHEAKKKKV